MTMALRKYEFDPYIDEYMRMVEHNEIESCEEQKQLMDFLRWKLSQPNIVIDHDIIEKSITKPEKYFPFQLFPWQKFINAFIFGVRYDDGRLMFNRFLILIGRGAGKNGYISWDSFFSMTGHHGIPRYDIDIVATSQDQARTSFDDVRYVIEDNELDKNTFYKSMVLIEHKGTRSKLQYNTSNARTKDGKRPGMVIFDEVHEYEDYSNIKVFSSALGKKPDPRQVYLTTDGYVRGGVLDDFKRESQMVLNKELPDSSLFPFICRLDDPKEVDDESKWEKANPSYRYNKHLQTEMKQEYHDMQINSALRIEFMTKRMNRPVEDVRKVVATYEDILATNKPIPTDLKGITAIGGVDFADVRDFCSVGLLFKKDGKRYWIQHTFIHHLALELQDINPEIIEIAKEKGLCTIIHNEKSISPDRVVNWFLEKLKTFNIKKIAMDDYRATILGPKLIEAGFEVEKVRRGLVTHGKLDPLIQDMFINQTLVFGDDPLMRWYVGNVYKDEQGNGNILYEKIEKETRKTDGFFAYTHALNLDHELKESQVITKENVKKIFKSYNF